MKENKNFRELLGRYQAVRDRINEIADACEREQRERNEAENTEYQSLVREAQLLDMRMRSVDDGFKENVEVNADQIVRENVAAGRQTEIKLVRAVTTTEARTGGIIPVKVQEILKPLQEGLILDKVGIPFPTGLAGDYVWPVYEAVEANILGEGVALTDSTLNLSKLTATPERIGVAIPVTRQTINQTEGVIENIVRDVIPQSVARLLNKILFSPVKVGSATSLVGPFVAAMDSKVSLSATPTFAELNKMKAKVLESGVEGSAMCWVMTKSMQAILEGEPINSKGVYRPVIENGMLCGLPVFTTNDIRNGGKEYIGLGDWRYQPMGLFGDISFIVDPYSQARKDAVDFVMNVNYGTKTLRPEAFVIGEVASA